MRIFLSIFILLIVALISVMGFRGSKSEKPPLEVFPDMDRQARFRAQGENSFFKDGRDDRMPPANTMARGNFLNYNDVFSDEFSDPTIGDNFLMKGLNEDGSYADGFPIPVNNEAMDLGHKKYEIFCMVCHGEAGDGNGVTKSYGVLAASYHDDRLRAATNGELFNVISYGKGQMFGLRDRISVEERWSIILYLRALQRSQNTSVKDLPDGKVLELGL
jgi:mono/diheme cytochrome c family protein